jgi:hypothetical protein
LALYCRPSNRRTVCLWIHLFSKEKFFFSYGGVINATSTGKRTSYLLGQSFTQESYAQTRTIRGGYWSRLLLAPQAPIVQVSQGAFPDRIELSWNIDPLSPVVTEEFVITRNGSFLASLGKNARNFIDFNVQAGEFYTYGVAGVNLFGEGNRGSAVGFVSPNGFLSGKVSTQNNNPVAGVAVGLSPTLGYSLDFDGVDDYLCVSYQSVLPDDAFTVSAWLRLGQNNDQSGIIDLGSDISKNWWIHTHAANEPPGINIGLGDGTSRSLRVDFQDNPEGWHYLVFTYHSGKGMVYLDGQFSGMIQAEMAVVPALFTMGVRRDQGGNFHGKLDEVRVFDRVITLSEMTQYAGISLSRNTPGLIAYWKFDEGMGNRAFDLTENNFDALIYGASFSEDHADIKNTGITDQAGIFVIEGINYSANQSFTAKPTKQFYSNYALEFNAAFNSYALLPAFECPEQTTLELLINPFDLLSRQSMLYHQSGDFELFIEDNRLWLTILGQTQQLGQITQGYQRISLSWTSAQPQVRYHLDGNFIQQLEFQNLGVQYSGSPWVLGARDTLNPVDYFTGLIDELAVFDTILSHEALLMHASAAPGGGIDAGDQRLRSYFSFNEGRGLNVRDYGASLSGEGVLRQAFFSELTQRQSATPHLFSPTSRIVNINSSNTAVSNVDFTDNSTISVSGVVRYENTGCYASGVEILVNNASNTPPIFTDENGRFVADFEPGANIKLTPFFADHTFLPGFFQVANLSAPIAGVLFQNQTKRKVQGQVAGGQCRMPILPEGANMIVRITAQQGCWSEEITISESDGKFSFDAVPPIPVRIEVKEHSDPAVETYFENQGGVETDMTLQQRDTIDFIYRAAPAVFISPFPENACGQKVIDQSYGALFDRQYTTRIRVYEDYYGERCYLDSVSLVINNQINDEEQISVFMDSTAYDFVFYAGIPNLTGDYTKFLQVTAMVNGASASAIERVVVLGRRSRESSFTTTAPSVPIIILRDPPGDASFASISSGTTTCASVTNATVISSELNANLKLALGRKIGVAVGPPVAQKILEFEVVNEGNIGVSVKQETSLQAAMEMCSTNEVTFITSSGEDVMYEDADLYIGSAINYEFGKNDILTYNDSLCAFELDEEFRVWPETFGTQYVYSGWQIKNTVIPTLRDAGDLVGVRAWERVLEVNNNLKEQAIFVNNTSFDGLAAVQTTQQSATSASFELAVELSLTASQSSELGFFQNETGASFTLAQTVTVGNTTTVGGNTTSTRTVTSMLADNDPNDSYSVDILMDPIYGTSVYKLRAGETMCPWQKGTLNREEVGFNIDRLVAVNIEENDAATFVLSLSNLGQTGNDPLVYILGPVENANPDGAVLVIDGEPLTEPRAFQLNPMETIQKTLSISRGPVAYTYNDLGIFFASQCQWEHARSLGYDLSNHDTANNGDPDLSKFYKAYFIDVVFTEPCSSVDIGLPQQDWVVTPDDDNTLSITLNRFDRTDPDLDLIRVQYRPSGGDGNWINIAEIPKDQLGPIFQLLDWDLTNLSDGAYEIRAITQCNNLSLSPGISRVIRGRKETQAPSLFGTPQPADGVLSLGDEISVQFTKRINCNNISQAEGIGANIVNNNVGLYDATTGALIQATVTCNDDKLIITPAIANQFIENKTLRVQVEGIRDLVGNQLENPIVWEFFVNRSALYWDGDHINETVIEGNALTVERRIRNQSGANFSYELENIPEWVEVFPTAGSIPPGGAQIITFSFANDIVTNRYQQTILLRSAEGVEPLELNLRVACPPPDWTINAASFSFSMSFSLELNIEGTLSNDRLDIVGAFVNGQLRGLAPIQFVPSLNKYLVFLTVYSNQTAGEIINFQVWDASDCTLFGSTNELFPFVLDSQVGTPSAPQVLHTNNMLLRKIYINPGWNWISYNVALPDVSLNAALQSLTNPGGGLIKGQASFSTYFNGAQSWLGTLNQLSHLTMYQYRSNAYDSLTLIGMPVMSDTPIPLQSGWNWLGYLPQRGLPINEALASLSPSNGDFVKGQFTFAQYVTGFGWIGSLNFMSSPNGYLLFLNNPDTLVYPSGSSQPIPGVQQEQQTKSIVNTHQNEDALPCNYWQLNPQHFEYSMNLIAVVTQPMGENTLSENDEVGAFVGNQLRGGGKVIYVEAIDAYMLFMTIYANLEGELVNFVLYDASVNQEFALIETISFQINTIIGSVDVPLLLTLPIQTKTELGSVVLNSFKAYPNPSNSAVFFEFSCAQSGEVHFTITDAYGRLIERIHQNANAGKNITVWQPPSSATQGLYMITLHKHNETQSQLIQLIK